MHTVRGTVFINVLHSVLQNGYCHHFYHGEDNVDVEITLSCFGTHYSFNLILAVGLLHCFPAFNDVHDVFENKLFGFFV